jgi:hypothetical protein
MPANVQMPDTQKGSFYANPLLDVPQVTDELRQQHPESVGTIRSLPQCASLMSRYYEGNVWPAGVSGLEEFEQTFKASVIVNCHSLGARG